VWGSHCTSADGPDADSIASSTKVSENSSESLGPQTRHVLEHEPFGSEFSDKSVHVGPEPPLVVFSESLASM
jgi:hypothetical protein